MAGFIGSPQMNFIDARINESNGTVSAGFKGGSIELGSKRAAMLVEFELDNVHLFEKETGEALFYAE